MTTETAKLIEAIDKYEAAMNNDKLNDLFLSEKGCQIHHAVLDAARAHLAQTEQAGERDVCQSCGGDGIERCDNPDHGLLNALSFRGANESACPCCGHDEHYRMKHWVNGKYEWNKCPDCGGTGTAPAQLEASGWMPIDTHPHDDKPFTGYSPSHGVCRDVYWHEDKCWFDFGEPRKTALSSGFVRDWTHWQPQEPLPPAPQINNKGE